MEKHGINAVKLTVQNAGPTDLFLNEQNIGLDLIPGKDISRLTRKSALWGLGKGLATTFALATGTLVGTFLYFGHDPTMLIAGYLATVTVAAIILVGTGSSLGKGITTSMHNATVKQSIKKNALGENGIRIPSQSRVELLVFTDKPIPHSIAVGLMQSGRLRQLTATVGRRTA